MSTAQVDIVAHKLYFLDDPTSALFDEVYPFVDEIVATYDDVLAKEVEAAYARLVVWKLVNGPVEKQLDTLEVCDVLGLLAVLRMHKQVDEIVAVYRQYRYVRMAHDGGISRRAMHDGNVLPQSTHTHSTQLTKKLSMKESAISQYSRYFQK